MHWHEKDNFLDIKVTSSKLQSSATLQKNHKMLKGDTNKIDDIRSFFNNINNFEEVIIYFRDENRRSEKKMKNINFSLL